jgi:hypothetical protein
LHQPFFQPFVCGRALKQAFVNYPPSTCLNEQGLHPDLIELQLAHAERNKVRAVYNRATRLADRRKMMQAWTDYLDTLRAGAEIVPLRRAAK